MKELNVEGAPTLSSNFFFMSGKTLPKMDDLCLFLHQITFLQESDLYMGVKMVGPLTSKQPSKRRHVYNCTCREKCNDWMFCHQHLQTRHSRKVILRYVKISAFFS